MSIADKVQEIMRARQQQFGNTSWWNDYLQASQGATPLADWMNNRAAGYADWSPEAANFASQTLTGLQNRESGNNGFLGISELAPLTKTVGNFAGKVVPPILAASAAYAGGVGLGALGSGATGAAEGVGAGTAGSAAAGGTAASGTTGGLGSWLGSLGGEGGAMDMYGASAIPGQAGAGTIFDAGSVPGATGAMGGAAGDMSGWLGADMPAGTSGPLDSTFSTMGGSGGLPSWLGTAGKIFGPSIANGIINGALGNRAQHQASDLIGRTDALNQPQRQPYQGMARDLLNNPQSYMTNNPFATALTNLYKNNVIPANIAKSGNTGFEADRLGAQFATALGGNYNQLAQILSGYGGFTQGAPTGGSAAPLYGQANQNYGEIFRGAGDAASKIFGTPQAPQTPTTNPITGSYTQVQ